MDSLTASTRTCCICKVVKPRTEFRHRNVARGWLQSFCKSCSNQQKKESYWRNPEKAKRIAKEWYHANKHGKYQETLLKYRTTHREEIRVRNRKRWLKKYGLDIEAYERLLASQGGVCMLCQRPPDDQRLAVDHDHNSGKVRGLLCAWCNRILGTIESFGGKDWLQRAMDHLNG